MAWRLSGRVENMVEFYSDKWLCQDGDHATLEIHHLPHNDIEMNVCCIGGMEVSYFRVSTLDLMSEWFPKGKELDYWKKDMATRERWACRVADDICRRFCTECKVK